MFKKLALTLLLVPSSLVIAGQPPMAPAMQIDTIKGNLKDSVAGFQEGFYKTTLAASRFTLSASHGISSAGNFFADHHILFGCASLGALAGLTYLFFKRPSRPAWMSMRPVYRIIQNGKQMVFPENSNNIVIEQVS